MTYLLTIPQVIAIIVSVIIAGIATFLVIAYFIASQQVNNEMKKHKRRDFSKNDIRIL